MSSDPSGFDDADSTAPNSDAEDEQVDRRGSGSTDGGRASPGAHADPRGRPKIRFAEGRPQLVPASASPSFVESEPVSEDDAPRRDSIHSNDWRSPGSYANSRSPRRAGEPATTEEQLFLDGPSAQAVSEMINPRSVSNKVPCPVLPPHITRCRSKKSSSKRILSWTQSPP